MFAQYVPFCANAGNILQIFSRVLNMGLLSFTRIPFLILHMHLLFLDLMILCNHE